MPSHSTDEFGDLQLRHPPLGQAMEAWCCCGAWGAAVQVGEELLAGLRTTATATASSAPIPSHPPRRPRCPAPHDYEPAGDRAALA